MADSLKTSKNQQVKLQIKGTAENPKAKISHPPISEMVREAIRELDEKKGSSLYAIKKYIMTKFDVTDRTALFIKKYLRNAVGSGSLIQTSGAGVSGSFKLAPEKKQSARNVEKSAPSKLKLKIQHEKSIKPIESKAPKKKAVPSKK